MAKVFISHSSQDVKLVQDFIELLRLGMNLTREEIFCTSLRGCLHSGKDFIPEIKKRIYDCEAVIFLITKAYMDSQFCLAELGAAWALGQKIFPLLVAPITHKEIEKTPLLGKQCLQLFDRDNLLQLGNEFNQSRIKQFHLTDFCKYVDEFLARNGIAKDTRQNTTFPPMKKTHKYVEKLEEGAENDDKARFLLGVTYWEGILAQQDNVKATQLLTQAAYHGYAPAQYKLSSMYYIGDTGKQSFKKAFEWEERASKGDNPAIWSSLAFLYRTGLGCKRDLDKALECYLRAGELGYKSAYSSVGEIYAIQANCLEAIKYYQQAADFGYQYAAQSAGMIYKEGGKDFQPDYIKAAHYFEIAAQAGITEAKYQMGQLYYLGYAVFERDFHSAVKWFREAAKEGDARAQYNMGYAHYHGLGAERDWDLATYWYEQAARRGHPLSQVDIADLYSLIDRQEYKKALYWYEEAANQGLSDAHRKLGDMYFFGIGCAVDQIRALTHYQAAAEQKDYMAQFRLEQFRAEGSRP